MFAGRYVVSERMHDHVRIATYFFPDNATLSTRYLDAVQRHIADLVLRMLSCSSSLHYRGIITATTSACLRYLGFERAYSVQWSQELRRCYVRAKADLSPRPLKPTLIEPTMRRV